ncbi:hypothetical protein [Streptomyces coeruleorubidus]|uniref:hypothetical protein n=1 Tax=Streptomyces coeruleorubidus TaxID=116188 RepID=UPI0036652DE4
MVTRHVYGEVPPRVEYQLTSSPRYSPRMRATTPAASPPGGEPWPRRGPCGAMVECSLSMTTWSGFTWPWRW